MTAHRKIHSKDFVIFRSVAIVLLTLLSAGCLLPFILLISGSLTPEFDILRNGYQLFPSTITFEAYKVLFESPLSIVRAYAVTITVTGLGTAFGLFFTAMAAFVLSNKQFKYRNQVSFFFYFTTIFGGGLVPWYIFLMKYLHFKNSIFAMIVPILINVIYMLIMKSYMRAIPDALYESAKLDGAGDFEIFWKVSLPLSKAALATIGLFTALNYWNDWYNAMLFIDNDKLYPLQYFLHNMLSKADFLAMVAARSGIPSADLPTEPMKLAMTVVATGPIILLYPFLQKYFVKGVTIGAVKG